MQWARRSQLIGLKLMDIMRKEILGDQPVGFGPYEGESFEPSVSPR